MHCAVRVQFAHQSCMTNFGPEYRSDAWPKNKTFVDFLLSRSVFVLRRSAWCLLISCRAQC